MSKHEQAEEEKEKVLTLEKHNINSTCKSDCDISVNELSIEEIHSTKISNDDKLNEEEECSESNSEKHNYHDENNVDDDDMELMDASVAHSLSKSRNACNTNVNNNCNYDYINDIAKKMLRRVECLTPLTEYLSPSSFTVESDETTKRNSSISNNDNNYEYLQNKSVTLTSTTPNHVHVHVPRYVDLACLVSNLNKMPKEHGRLFGRYYRTFYKHFQHIVLDVIDTLTQHSISVDNKTIHNKNDKEINVLMEELENVHITKVEYSNNINVAQYHYNNTETNFVLDSDNDDNDKGKSEEEEEEEETVSEEFFSRLGATAQCNSFGVYTSSGESIAFGFYPFASYFNHSCNPNLCRAMYEYGFQCAGFYALRDIAVNEPLTICYIDVEEENSAIRRQQLMASYRFNCECERCAGSVSLSSSTAHHMELCTNCHIHGYMRPRECLESQVTSTTATATTNNNKCEINTTECHTKAGMQIKECTVCRRRVLQTNASNSNKYV